MQIYDIIMLVILLFTIIMGYRRGLAWQVASLAAIGVSYFVAINFRDVVAAKINAEQPWNTFLAMLILYVGTSFSIWIVFQMVKGIIDKAKLKEFDQQLGAIIGAVKGAALCIVITFFGVTLLGPHQTQAIVQSRSGYYISKFLDKATGVMPQELSQVLGPYLEKLDKGLEGANPKQDPYFADDNFGATPAPEYNANRIPQQDVQSEWDSTSTYDIPSTYETSETENYEPTATNPDPYYIPPTGEFERPFRR